MNNKKCKNKKKNNEILSNKQSRMKKNKLIMMNLK